MKAIDPKFSIDAAGNIIHASGAIVPEDEPLMLFRARDWLTLPTLRHYRELAIEDGCTEYHLRGLDERIAAFEAFQREHPERMKQPGITRGMPISVLAQSAQPDFELRERCRQYGARMMVRTERDGKRTNVAYSDLTAEEQEYWIRQWSQWRAGGWEGPHYYTGPLESDARLAEEKERP